MQRHKQFILSRQKYVTQNLHGKEITPQRDKTVLDITNEVIMELNKSGILVVRPKVHYHKNMSFTKGKRHASLKERSNRRKAKS